MVVETVKNKFGTEKYNVLRNFNSAAEDYDSVAVLQKRIAEQLLERLELIRIQPTRILDLGSGTGAGARLLKKKYPRTGIVQMDFAEKMLSVSVRTEQRWFSRQSYVCGDAHSLPIRAGVIDLTFSNLMLQWCNEPARVFAEVQRVSNPGGLFIFSSFGPDTLRELRASWSTVDDDMHVNAFLDMHDVGDALLQAGFESPVMENEYYTLTYEDMATLFRELKLLGAGNANSRRRRTLTGRGRLQQVREAYERFRINGRLPATYEVVIGHAWCGSAGRVQTHADGEVAIPVAAIKRHSRQQ